MSSNLARTTGDMTTQQAGAALAKSGYFEDAKSEAQAIVKVMAGQEMGFGPIASMTGIHVIKGKIAVGASLMAAAVKRSGKYNYRVLELTDTACELAFFEGGQEAGRSRFTSADAVKAQTQNMQKYPKNMLFARALSNGVKWYAPDVFLGAPVYTPEELGATVDGEGDLIVLPPESARRATPAPTVRNIDPDKHDRGTEWADFEEVPAPADPRQPREAAELSTCRDCNAVVAWARIDGRSLLYDVGADNIRTDNRHRCAQPAPRMTPADRRAAMITKIRGQMRQLEGVIPVADITLDLDEMSDVELIAIGTRYKAQIEA